MINSEIYSKKYFLLLSFFLVFFEVHNFTYSQDTTKNLDTADEIRIKDDPFFTALGEENLEIISETDPLLILPLGNSITFGKRTNDTRPDEDKISYRYTLYNLLKKENIDFNFIGSEHSGSNYLPNGFDSNGGFPGIKDNELANLLITGNRVQPPSINLQITPGPYLETYLPDIILLHIGTNGNDLVGGTSEADIEIILNEIDSIESSSNKEIYVILSRIIDRVPNETYVNLFNNNVEIMALDRINNPDNPSYPDKIIIVDMEDGANLDYIIDLMGTQGNGIIGDMNDTLHPNDKGYNKMAQVWFDSIKSIFPNPINIIKNPISTGTIVGNSVTFSVDVESSKPLFYQWKLNGEKIPGATDSVYSTPSVMISDDSASFICELSSGFYVIESDTATLFVTDSTSRVSGGLISLFDFEEGKGDSIFNKVNNYSELDLIINDSSQAEWIPFGLKVNGNPSIYSKNSIKKSVKQITKNNELTLEAWIEPANDVQIGPARIVTISESISNRNITLGQDGNKFEVRLRTSETSNNGIPSIFSSSSSAANKLTHVVYTRKNDGEVRLYINGQLNINFNIPGSLSNWDSTYYFGLASEILGNKYWLGKYYLVSLYDRCLNYDEIFHNYNFKFNGYDFLLERPTNLTAEIQKLTDVGLNWSDNSNKEMGFVIERRSNKHDSLFTIIDSVGINETSFIDTTKKYDSSLVYRVRAFKDIYLSDYSNEVIISELPVSVYSDDLIKNEFQLYQNFPNPFNPTTRFKYSIAKNSEIQLTVFNSLGETVRTILSNKVKPIGVHSEVFNAHDLATGVYFYRLVAKPTDGSGTYIKINKAILIK